MINRFAAKKLTHDHVGHRITVKVFSHRDRFGKVISKSITGRLDDVHSAWDRRSVPLMIDGVKYTAFHTSIVEVES